MLLAGLQGEPIGRAPAAVHRHPDQPAGERALMRRPRCDVGRMRPAIAHGHAEALGGADGDIGAELAGRCDQRERQGIGRHDRKRAGGMQSRNRRPEVPDGAGASGILQQRSEHRVRIKLGQRIAGDDAPAQRLGAGADDRKRLRVAVAIDEESLRLRARNPPRHGHAFGRGGRLVEQRRVGDFEPGEIRDHGLEVQQGFQAALADLGLIRRISRVPRRIFQDVARDHGRRDRAVIALADHRDQHLVLARNRAQLLQSLAFRQRRAEIERVPLPNALRHRLRDQCVEACGSDRLQHVRQIGGGHPDVARGKLVLSEHVDQAHISRHRLHLACWIVMAGLGPAIHVLVAGRRRGCPEQVRA